jgi:hypothetical protein
MADSKCQIFASTLKRSQTKGEAAYIGYFGQSTFQKVTSSSFALDELVYQFSGKHSSQHVLCSLMHKTKMGLLTIVLDDCCLQFHGTYKLRHYVLGLMVTCIALFIPLAVAVVILLAIPLIGVETITETWVCMGVYLHSTVFKVFWSGP